MLKDKSKLVPKKIRDKNGKATTVWVSASAPQKKERKPAAPDWKKPVEMTLHHGTVNAPFKKFRRNKVAYLSVEPQFATDYANQKSFEQQLDADIHTAKANFKGVLFDPHNKEMLKEFVKTLPDMVEVRDGLWGFGAKIPKKDFIYNMRGFIRKDPHKDTIGKKVGDTFIWTFMANNKMLIIDKDDKYFTAVSVSDIDTSAEKALGAGEYGKVDPKYADKYNKWKDDLQALSIEVDNAASDFEMEYDIDRVKMIMGYTEGLTESQKKVVNGIDEIREYVKKDIVKRAVAGEKVKGNWGTYDILSKKHFNHVEVVEDMKDNWNYMESGFIMDKLKELGYDGYQAWEKGAKTLAIFNPAKTVKIESWGEGR